MEHEEGRILRERLHDIMNKRGYSQTKVARSIGVTGAVLSSWLSDTYKGDNDRIRVAVNSFLDLEWERQRKSRNFIPFTMTSVAQSIFKAARICHIDGEIGVVYGMAGIGKTYAVKEYAARNQDVILIEADAGYTAKELFSELIRKCGGYASSSINEMKNDLIRKLRDSGRLIIVDEAENLPFKAIDLLRRVYDKAGVGILFVGINRLYEGLIAKRTIYSYILSRIGVAICLNPVTQEDVGKIMIQILPEGNGLSRTFFDMSRGNARTVSKLIFRSKALADENGVPITQEMIRKVGRELFI